MIDRIEEPQPDADIPACEAAKDPIVRKILDTIWSIMNDDRIKHWVEHGYGASSPDIVGGLDMYVSDAQTLAREIASIKDAECQEEKKGIFEEIARLFRYAFTDSDVVSMQWQSLKDKHLRRR